MREEQKQIKQNQYKNRVIDSIKRYTERNINIESQYFSQILQIIQVMKIQGKKQKD